MPDEIVVPLTVSVPLTVLTGAVEIPLIKNDLVQSVRLLRVTGHLNALTSGTFTVAVRGLPGDVALASLSWTAAGQKSVAVDQDLAIDGTGAVRLNVTGLGIGAGACTLVLWLQIRY